MTPVVRPWTTERLFQPRSALQPAAGQGFRMVFVIVGVILVVCNLMDWGPMGAWNWQISGDLWKFVLPFVLATAWWIFSDVTGWTKRKAMDNDAKRKRDRLDRNIDAMGLGHLHKHRDGKTRQKQ